ncbi:uncharacterized protein LOC142002030 [Carettochelys insculpta]|uniref:uncharacterized protein LOC142002030 n=1 Tax=Carettochelys insculpta TaxID=44489 RepID=UPI003EBF1825
MGEWNDERWLRNFHMSWQTFMELCQWLTPALRHHNTRMRHALPVEKRVAIAVWKLATPDSYRSVGQQFGVGKATVGAVLMEVVRALNALLLKRVIRVGDLDAAVEGFAAMGFPNCFGALDGTHIPICTPDHSGGHYINRKGNNTLVLQAMVDSHGRFQEYTWAGPAVPMVHAFSGIRDYAADCRREPTSPQREIPLGDTTTVPLCIVGDAAYPLQPWLIRPYTGHLNASQKRYSARLNHACQVVKRAFGRLKGHWRCLLARLDLGLQNIPQVVGACCTLHNLVESKGEAFMQGWALEAGTAYPQPTTALSCQAHQDGVRVPGSSPGLGPGPGGPEGILQPGGLVSDTQAMPAPCPSTHTPPSPKAHGTQVF